MNITDNKQLSLQLSSLVRFNFQYARLNLKRLDKLKLETNNKYKCVVNDLRFPS